MRDGPAKHELQRRLRRASTVLSFEAACDEVLSLEYEYASGEHAMACKACAVPPPPRPTSPTLDNEQLKEALWTGPGCGFLD